MIGELAITEKPVRLVIVGDGQASDAVARRAADVNAAAGRNAILLTGGLADPAPAYAAADIIVGQGGSALRGMAFAKPLVVIGEEGFSELLTPESAPIFLRQGWYGLGPGSFGSGVSALRLAIDSLVNAPELRRELGLFGRRLVEERFSLTHAAQVLEQTYMSAIRDPLLSQYQLSELARCATQLFNHKIRRRYHRWLGTARTDDSNARSQIAAVLAKGEQGGETAH